MVSSGGNLQTFKTAAKQLRLITGSLRLNAEHGQTENKKSCSKLDLAFLVVPGTFSYGF